MQKSRKLQRFLHRCDIIVVRKTMNNSKPYKHCLKFLKKCGIRRVYYSFNKSIIVEKVSNMDTDHISAKNRKK